MASATESKPTLKIVVVDDEEDIGDIFRFALAPHGHDVTFVNNGLEAVRIAGKHPFDVAFIDVTMSPMDGLSTLSRLRAISPATRYIMISAFYSDELSRRVRSRMVTDAMQLGARGCLRKPLDLDTILQAAEYFGAGSARRGPSCDAGELVPSRDAITAAHTGPISADGEE